jgi:hypothetical protein
MRRRRKKRSPLSVSLFPFLAVLICTLGVLIVMLVMAVKAADDQSVQTQSADDSEKLARISVLEESLDFNRLQIDGIKMVRPDAVARLNQSRANRSYIQDEIRKLKLEFERVGEALRELANQSQPVTTSIEQFSEQNALDELAQLDQKLAAAKIALQKKRESAKRTGPATYVIVPHKGAGGTFRRPIFIECEKDSITLQPAGIRLEKSEFAPPLEPGNMLDSALLAIREYWQRYDLAGSEGSPYPLIVVRPEGAETFVLARHAMKSWDDEFGYELVESEKNLDYGTRDPQLETEIKDAIDEARRRQRYRVSQAVAAQPNSPRFERQGSRPGLTASGRSGGFVSNAGGFDEGDDTREHPDSRSRVSQTSIQDDRSTRGDPEEARFDSQSQTSATNGNSAGDSSVQNPNADQSIAKQRGKNWALPSQTPGATGYVRPIRIICGADRLEIHSATGPPKRIPLNGETADAIDQLVEEVWQQIDSWGVAGANGFWKPQLRITVAQDGLQRFKELKGLLFQSGLTLAEAPR